MITLKKTNCYIYTRVSTVMQVDGYSLDAQREKLRKYAEFQEMQVVGEYSDEGKSGKNIGGRPQFQQMLEDIKDGYYDFSGKFITALPTFAEGTKIMNNTCFSGNCAFVFIQGVDKRYYASMFDKTGKILFEPVMVSPYPLDNVEKDFFMGFFKYTDGFLNSEGKTVSFDELPDEVKAYYDPESVKLPTPEYITATAGTKYPSGSKASAVKTAV